MLETTKKLCEISRHEWFYKLYNKNVNNIEFFLLYLQNKTKSWPILLATRRTISRFWTTMMKTF